MRWSPAALSGLLLVATVARAANDPFQVKVLVSISPCQDAPAAIVKNVSKGHTASCEAASALCESVDAELQASARKFCPLTCRLCKVVAHEHFTLKVQPEWAPAAAARFREMVEAGVLNGMRFWKVTVDRDGEPEAAHFGVSGYPVVNKGLWTRQLKAEAVLRPGGNEKGTLAFKNLELVAQFPAQMILNLRHNTMIQYNTHGYQDNAPFAEITTLKGLDVARRLFSGYKDNVNQGAYMTYGEEYVLSNFPKASLIVSAKVLKKKSDKSAEL
jgi:cyclophilin family peptidyl-prolyl cis-trans isomerase